MILNAGRYDDRFPTLVRARVRAFNKGASFDGALAAAGRDEPEVAEIADLYIEIDEGTWDCHGYWRLPP